MMQIRGLYLKGCTAKEADNEMKQVCADDAPSYDVEKHGHHHFECGRTLMETALISGCPPRSAIDDNTIHKVEFTRSYGY